MWHTNHPFQQHNARRAELHRLKEKHPEQYARLQARGALNDDEDGQEEESTSEDEVWGPGLCALDESVYPPCHNIMLAHVCCCTHNTQDDGFIAEDTEAQILETLKKLRRKDPEIYDPSKRFFVAVDDAEGDEEDDEQEEDEGKKPTKSKKDKPMLLKDVLYQQVGW